MSPTLRFLSLIALLVASAGAYAQESSATLENVALGASYTLQPNPSYGLCSDPGDLQQLTDGEYTTEYFWSQKSTVGWGNARTVIVTLDLGAVQPIRGVSMNTAAGTAGVAWPMAVRIFVGDGDRQFREAGDLLALAAVHGEPAPKPYSIHRYWTDALHTHGRYVALVITNQPYTFVDEIEVYQGDPAWLSEPVAGEAIPDVAAHMEAYQIRDAISRRLHQDIAGVREKAEDPAVPVHVRLDIVAELDAVTEAMAKIPEPGPDFKAILPLNGLHRRIFDAQAMLWPETLTCWQTPLWAPLSHLADPPTESNAQVDVALMQNEYRAASLNLSNGTQKDAALTLRIEGLPGGVNPEYVTVHEVAWTDTASGIPVASALPEAKRNAEGWQIDAPTGLTRQVWFTFHPVAVEPGDYTGQVVLTGGPAEVTVPLRMKLYPLRFPDTPSLGFGGWDYTDGSVHRGVNDANRTLLINHLRERYVNAPWATSGVIPRGVYDASGKMTTPPDTKNFDEWVARWPEAAYYCIFAAVGDTFDRWAMDAPQFATAVGEWANFWSAHAREKGVDPAQLSVLLYDEPHAPEQDAIIIAWAKAIKAAGAGWTIWEDPTYQSVSESQAAMVAECDVLCPNRQIFVRADEEYRDFYRSQRAAGKRLEFYACSGPSSLLDPYSYYRLQAWTCWKEGAKASYFWAFGDNADISPWNEYLAPRNIYTLSFLDDTSVVPAKMMEAAREGVEDYEYFVMLQAAVDKAPEGPARTAAKQLLEMLPDKVLDAGITPGMMWHDEMDRTLADKGRVEVLEALVSLKAY